MRPAESPASAALTLARVLDGERPSWASREAWEGLREALAPLLDEARAIVAEHGVAEGARYLGLSRATVIRARASGPLAPK